MLDVFLKQDAIKVIVGDTHQQIYGWRSAENSLNKVTFDTYQLTSSFRFSQDIANLAVEILKRKEILEKHTPVCITGKGGTEEYDIKAVLARTNLGLLLKAIEYVTEKKNLKHLYFEGNINSYTYADEGASLYDVLDLYNGKQMLAKDKLIREMKNLKELDDYIEKTEDVQLKMMVEIVKEYGNKIPGIIKTIKRMHVSDDEKNKAQMIFSTVHRSKGMEYDAVQIVPDFITQERLEKLIKDNKEEVIDFAKIYEEINLLYVAVTRSKHIIHIPETLMPPEFPYSSKIHVLKVFAAKNKWIRDNTNVSAGIQKSVEDVNSKNFPNNQFREEYLKAYTPWSEKQDNELIAMYSGGVNSRDLAKHFGRSKGAITSRIRKLEL